MSIGEMWREAKAELCVVGVWSAVVLGLATGSFLAESGGARASLAVGTALSSYYLLESLVRASTKPTPPQP